MADIYIIKTILDNHRETMVDIRRDLFHRIGVNHPDLMRFDETYWKEFESRKFESNIQLENECAKAIRLAENDVDKTIFDTLRYYEPHKYYKNNEYLTKEERKLRDELFEYRFDILVKCHRGLRELTIKPYRIF